MVVCVCNPSTKEAEAGFLQEPGQVEMHSSRLPLKGQRSLWVHLSDFIPTPEYAFYHEKKKSERQKDLELNGPN